MKVTVKDVAKLANVSPSSVSRYLNDPNSIHADNAFRIKNAIDSLGYIPSPVARSLKSGRSNLIGVIVPTINSYFNLICRAISDFFYQQGYLVFFCESGEEGEKEQYYLDQMIQLHFEGILLCSISSTEEELERISKKTDMILLTRRIAEVNVDNIRIDNEGLAKQLTDYALSLGHRRILGLFASEKSAHSLYRLSGAQSIISANSDISFVAEMNCQNSSNAYKAIEKHLNGPEVPDVIISYGLTVTENTIIAMNGLKLNIPEDISFLGWGLNDFRSKYHISVPMIEENPYEMGISASSILLRRIKNPEKKIKPKTYIFPATLKK